MDEGPLYSIGDPARRTGLPVRTIRFHSDPIPLRSSSTPMPPPWLINGWPVAPALAPVVDWFARALRHHREP